MEARIRSPDEQRVRAKDVKRRIMEFEQDDEGHWRAVLDCGHRQHVRHEPPLRVREWVLTAEGRATRLGQELNCLRCDEAGTG